MMRDRYLFMPREPSAPARAYSRSAHGAPLPWQGIPLPEAVHSTTSTCLSSMRGRRLALSAVYPRVPLCFSPIQSGNRHELPYRRRTIARNLLGHRQEYLQLLTSELAAERAKLE